jgi:uncharacterized protein (DUF779 family)
MNVATGPRVLATPEAIDAIDELVESRGPVLFFLSAGCCDGSIPMCFGVGEFVISSHDVLLGTPGGCPFYIDVRQCDALPDLGLLLDVSDGEPEGFSLPAGAGRHFVTRDLA